MHFLLSTLTGIIVGIFMTIPLGPISIYVAHRTMDHETWKGMHVAIGSVIVDVLYCLVITLGLISLISPYLQNMYVQLGLSVFLILYGLKMLFFNSRRSQSNGKLKKQRERFEKSHYNIMFGMTMALANPTLFISWTAVIGFISAHQMFEPTFWDKVIFSFATGVGSFGWFAGLVLFVRAKRHTLSQTFLRRASAFTALVIIGFGMYFSITIIRNLNSLVLSNFPAVNILRIFG